MRIIWFFENGLVFIFNRDRDGKVTSEELVAAAVYFKENLDKAGVQEIIANLSKDKSAYIFN